jgi:hypothetical protein
LLARLSALRAESRTGLSSRIRAQVREIVPQYQWAPPENTRGIPVPLLTEPQTRYRRTALASGSD